MDKLLYIGKHRMHLSYGQFFAPLLPSILLIGFLIGYILDVVTYKTFA